MQIQFLVGEQIGVIEIFENFETHRIRLNGKIDKSNESNRPISCAQETCTGTFKTETELTKHNTRCHSDSFIIK